MISEVKPICLTGFGERVFGLQYRQGNRVYDSSQIAVCLTSSPVGGMGGGCTNLYLVEINKEGKEKTDERK